MGIVVKNSVVGERIWETKTPSMNELCRLYRRKAREMRDCTGMRKYCIYTETQVIEPNR